jgi:hypothetical protein
MKKTKTQVGALHGPGRGLRVKAGKPTRHVWIIEESDCSARDGWTPVVRNYRTRNAANEALEGYQAAKGYKRFKVTKYVPGEGVKP